MTALKEFARLECPGVWRRDQEARRINVNVAFGETSLVISDGSDRALSHWSLAAVARVNPGERPALFCPSAEATEILEIADDTMIDAIEKIRKAVVKARPKGGRLRRILLGASVAAVAAGLVFWLPDALVRHTVGVVPDPTRVEIGTALFQAISRVAGAPCRSAGGDRALAQLYTRLVAPEKGALLVLPGGIDGAVSLPGGLILLNKVLVEDHDTPDVVAGYTLAETERRAQTDPLAQLLLSAGTFPTLRLLTTGALQPETLNDYAETLIAMPPQDVASEDLLRRFAAAKVPSTPYAFAVDITGESVLELIEADPMRGGGADAALADRDWIALQEICGG